MEMGFENALELERPEPTEGTLETMLLAETKETGVDLSQKQDLINLGDMEALKKKYGEVYLIEMVVDADDTSNGRKLAFIFKRPTMATFNRYLKTCGKNMAASTTAFVQDNIVAEQEELLKVESNKYPGLALAIGTRLLTAIGLVDDVNFKKL